MTEIEHLQSVLLSIAKDIDALCRKNHIDYYLLGGSCIGAIRHHGFIPWDDDLDIVMTKENYVRFIEVCRTQLDLSKYCIQEGRKDWPLNFTKIRLRGTRLHEPEDGYATEDEMQGIFIDVFYLENVPDNEYLARLQYILAKYYLCYQLLCRNYKHASFKKKLMIASAAPMKIGLLRKLIVGYIEKFGGQQTERLGLFYGRTRYRTSGVLRWIYGKPKYVPFEDTELPVPEHYHEYLTQMFGDYMKLPPVEQRQGLHLVSVDFGRY